MRRRRVNSAEPGSVSNEPSLIDYGRYPIPVLEQTYGLTSQHNVVFGQDTERVWEILDLTFESIRSSGELPDTDDANSAAGAESQAPAAVMSGAPQPHPSLVFAARVKAAIMRCLPDVNVAAPADPNLADWQLTGSGHDLFIEVKWKADFSQPFAASVLQRIVERIPEDGKLLVIVDGLTVSTGQSFSGVKRPIGDRGYILSWLDEDDDSALRSTLVELLGIDDGKNS